ncbi:MAG: hypothetical protein CMJ64_10500 [Planctomycetaceae bacterium]|nr:hypothetical protein [Planctomycetaceae bacterium]
MSEVNNFRSDASRQVNRKHVPVSVYFRDDLTTAGRDRLRCFFGVADARQELAKPDNMVSDS